MNAEQISDLRKRIEMHVNPHARLTAAKMNAVLDELERLQLIVELLTGNIYTDSEGTLRVREVALIAVQEVLNDEKAD